MLNKVRILAFRDKELHAKVGEFTLQINPESYRHDNRTWFSQVAGSDTAGSVLKFRSYYPQELKFDFVLDATGVVPGVKNVTREIAAFKDVAYDYHGAIHSPYYLKVLWGGLAFKCMLSSMAIDYQLFDPSGKPLRAKLSVSFRQHQTPQDLARKGDKKSADLTHSEQTIAGDTLPLISNRVYDRPDLYVHIARANDLNDIMHLQAGQRLRLPPVRE